MVTLYTLNNKLVKAGSKFFGILPEPPRPDPFMPIQIGNQIWSGKNLDLTDPEYPNYQHVTMNVTYTGTSTPVTEHYYAYQGAVNVLEANGITGWRIPTKEDFDTLLSYLGISTYSGIEKLQSTTGWTPSGTNTSGFGALPTGWIDKYIYVDPSITDFGSITKFLTSTTYTDSYDAAKYCLVVCPKSKSSRNFYWSYSTYNSGGGDMYNPKISVRLIKDV